MENSKVNGIDIFERLKQTLFQDAFDVILLVMKEATGIGIPLYLVGGVVRDLYLNKPPKDLDLVLQGDAISFVSTLVKKYGGTATTHSRFRTATWTYTEASIPKVSDPSNVGTMRTSRDGKSLDLITARSEKYKTNAALPVIFPGTIVEDIRRRDFSINTLAFRLDGNHPGSFLDEVGGLEDLRRGIIRVLHQKSFREDPTRIFRAVRYEKRLGFTIEPTTLALLRDGLSLIDKLSAARVRHELDRILLEENYTDILSRLQELGVLAHVHGFIKWDEGCRSRCEKIPRENGIDPVFSRWIAWLLDLSRRDLSTLDNRLHFRASLRENLYAASTLYQSLGAMVRGKPSKIVDELDQYPITAIQVVRNVSQDLDIQQKLSAYLSEWRYVKPKTTGTTLVHRGFTPGPKFSEILKNLRHAWLDGKIRTAEEEEQYLEKLL